MPICTAYVFLRIMQIHHALCTDTGKTRAAHPSHITLLPVVLVPYADLLMYPQIFNKYSNKYYAHSTNLHEKLQGVRRVWNPSTSIDPG